MLKLALVLKIADLKINNINKIINKLELKENKLDCKYVSFITH